MRPKASNPGEEDSYFECNICLDGVREPVVTRCGHLFCWPCLYRWLNTNQTECPVCKAGVTASNVIPLYGRGAESVDPRTKPTERDGVPSRPEAERPQAARLRHANAFTGGFDVGGGGGAGATGVDGVGNGAVAGGHVHFQAGLGFFPSLFGLQFQSFTSPARPAGARAGDDEVAEIVDGSAAVQVNRGPSREGGAVEEAQQAFLSRVLLVLGSFVVLCLVLF
ncbi:unnamed protein product [Ectocarpus sp. 6 AP-2014]